MPLSHKIRRGADEHFMLASTDAHFRLCGFIGRGKPRVHFHNRQRVGVVPNQI